MLSRSRPSAREISPPEQVIYFEIVQGYRLTMDCWHLYVVRTIDGFLYTGITTDVQRRFREHLAQGSRTAGYLRAHKPGELAFSMVVGNRGLALKVEYQFKRLSRPAKERIVASGRFSIDEDSGRIAIP
jgi:putative endonuclease